MRTFATTHRGGSSFSVDGKIPMKRLDENMTRVEFYRKFVADSEMTEGQ